MNYTFEITDEFNLEPDLELSMKLEKILELPDCLILHLSGKINGANASKLKKNTTQLIEAGYQNFVLDFTELTYASSAGLGTITFLKKYLTSRNGNLVLHNPNSMLYDLIWLLALNKYFDITEEISEAINVLYPDSKEIDTTPFPKIFRCPVCSKKLLAKKNGNFRCSMCKTGLLVDEAADIHLL